jgi:hypothetical protein
MAKFPFQLLIERGFGERQTESLTCTALLRIIPGRRVVYDALWNDRPVIVKVFSHRISAKRHLKREWRGLKLLRERGLNSPRPLFYGKTGRHAWAVVTEKIDNANRQRFNRWRSVVQHSRRSQEASIIVQYKPGISQTARQWCVTTGLTTGQLSSKERKAICP